MLAGKVAWITRGGSGIGLAGAIELARAGAHVVISGRSKETLAVAEKQLKAAGKGEALAVDVADKMAMSAPNALFFGRFRAASSCPTVSLRTILPPRRGAS